MTNDTTPDGVNENGVDTTNGLDGLASNKGAGSDDLAYQLEEARLAIKRLNAEAKGHREAKEQAIADLQKARDDQLKKQGEYKELYEAEVAKTNELSTKATKAERLEAAVMASNEQRISLIPEAMRDIVPDLSPEELSAWLDKSLPKLTAPPIPGLDGGKGGMPGNKPPSNVSEDDKKSASIANRYGYKIDAEAVANRRKQITK